MQRDFATFVVGMDTLQAGAVRKHETKKWIGSKMKGLPKRNSPSPNIITKNEDQAKDHNIGLEAKVFREEARTTPTRDLWEFSPQSIRIFPPDKLPCTGTKIQRMPDHLINAQINLSIETMERGLELNPSTIRTEPGKTQENFFVPSRLKGEISRRTIHTANQELINLAIVLPQIWQ